MNVTTHERPGVYSTYDASSVISGKTGSKTVAMLACGSGMTPAQKGTLVTLTSFEQAVARFAHTGRADCVPELVRAALLNGAGAVVVAPIFDAEDEQEWDAAVAAVQALEGIAVVTTNADDEQMQEKLRDSVEQASLERRERIAVVGMPGGTTEVEALTGWARYLNHERMVLVSGKELDDAGEDLGGHRIAAAAAGAIAGTADPAVPLGGAELKGLGTLAPSYNDNEVDQLIQNGVTVVERVGSTVSVVRGVTTRSHTGETSDETWKELSTVLIVDDVIPTIRAALRSKFRRAKNTAQSRSAIKSQVILELENKKNREVITGYEHVMVTADEERPTVCLVDFSFSVAHGLNQIWVSAHISV